MVTLLSHPKQVSLSSAPTPQDVVPLAIPLTLSSVHQFWTQALSLTPPSPSLSLTHLKRLLRTLNLLPQPLLTPAQTAPLYLNVALILAYLGEYFLAAESFRKAVELDGSSAIGWHGLGGMNFLLGDWKAARKAWKICLAGLESRKTLKYFVWKIGGSGAETEKGKRQGEWVLEKGRVEWNLSFAMLKDKEQREQLKEKVWGINGIPAGLVFGPSFPAYSDNLYAAKENIGLKKGHIEGTKANPPRQIPTKIPLASTRASSHATETSTKPLPALPDHIPSTPIPLPRTQKGISLARLFTRPRTSSASKTQALRPKRPDLPAAPFTCNDLSTTPPVIEESHSRTSSGTGDGALLCSNFQQFDTFDNSAVSNPDFFNNVFDTDSVSEPVTKADADADADELKYYFSTRPEAEIDMDYPVTRSALVISTSLPPLVPRSTFFRPGRIQYPLMEMRDEIREEMRERNERSHAGGRRRNAIPTKVEAEEGKKVVTTVENKEWNKTAPPAEKESEGAIKIKSKESKEGSTKVEDKKWDRTATKTDENKRSAIARNLQLQHKDVETVKVEIGKDDVRGRSGGRNVETQMVVKGRGAERKIFLETVLETNPVAESQETEKNNQVRARSERSNPEDQTAAKGREAAKEKILGASTAAMSQQAQEKNEVRGRSKKRSRETRASVKCHEEQEGKNREASTGASQKIEKASTPNWKEPETLKPAEPELAMQEPELEYLKPVRFEGFNGEWREADLKYEAEVRMEKEKLNGGK